MLAEMRGHGTPVGPIEISSFENEARLVLPDDYSLFLQKNNGGRPIPKFFPIAGYEGNPFGQVQDFFGIGDSVASCDLLWNFKTFRGRIGSDYLAIAREDGGNLICLDISKFSRGRVVYWDARVGRPKVGAGIYEVAPSFDNFLENLRDIDPLNL
ncbi:hypothetical protein GCM10007320_22600 [Pseudorhodoferax aquiterrae]|uniref:Knr4/Smi1-like domain-containing protein n=1 Tax=Pseudorhodoferax aquiterrae TaxID=747304 RepID=A0ABQ3G0K9_9BURK|nr:SMI1/KNR4 family protein [Pseudorhodoferax aquiterrae]GHC80720.1 hypothetical protein GCM10007320_22600 [Pseudorhodoferax aquiterrae]